MFSCTIKLWTYFCWDFFRHIENSITAVWYTGNPITLLLRLFYGILEIRLLFVRYIVNMITLLLGLFYGIFEIRLLIHVKSEIRSLFFGILETKSHICLDCFMVNWKSDHCCMVHEFWKSDTTSFICVKPDYTLIIPFGTMEIRLLFYCASFNGYTVIAEKVI